MKLKLSSIEFCQDNFKLFGEKVREKRILMDWSVEQLAIEVNRTRRTIIKIETGLHVPCWRTIAQILLIWPDLNLEFQKNVTRTQKL